MKRNYYYLFQALIDLPFGVLLFIAPSVVFKLQFTDLFVMNDYIDTISRAYGSVLIAVGTANLLHSVHRTTKDGFYLVLMGLVGGTIYVFVHARAMMLGIMNPASSGTLVLVAILAIWSLFILLRKRSENA